MTIAIPALERSKEGGEEGQKKLASITRYSTVVIGLLQGFAYYMLIRNNSLLESTGIWPAIVIILTFTAGSALIMWLGEQISEFGIGNGISIILFASIVSRFPSGVATMITNVSTGGLSVIGLILMLLGALAIVVLIIFVTNAKRRIPVQYSKRVVGRKMYGGQEHTFAHEGEYVRRSAHNLCTVNRFSYSHNSGLLPHSCDRNLLGRFPECDRVNITAICNLLFLLIIFFAYFYSTIQFNPVEIANNLKKNGGFIPGFRPGKPTSEYIQKSLNKITLFGALYLGIVAVVPVISAFSESAANSGISLEAHRS